MAAENTPSAIQNKQAFANRFNQHFGDMVIRKITELDIQRYKLERKSSGDHATGTIDNELSTLNISSTGASGMGTLGTIQRVL